MSKGNPNWVKQYYFLPKNNLKSDAEKWQWLRKRAQREISASAQLKLEWIIYYHTAAEKCAKDTALQFGVTRKTVHKWLARFKQEELVGFEEKSCAPHHVRKRQISLEQRVRVKSLRGKFPKYGKMKLVGLYKKQYKESISSWKIQKIIEEGNLYPDRAKATRLRKKQVQARIHARQRITKFIKEKKVNHLWHVDTVILTLSSG